MNSAIKNLAIILGIVAVVFAGYYFMTQTDLIFLRSTATSDQLDALLDSANEFAERQRRLDAITLDISVLDSPILLSLRTYAPDPEEFEVGRPDPFLPTAYESVVQPAAEELTP